MGSDYNHFNVSLIVRDKVTRQCPPTTTFLKRRESRSGIEPRPFCLPAERLTARPHRLTNIVRVQFALSTEAIWLIRDGGRGGGGRGRKSESSTADTARKRPERPWTAARTMEVLRRCPLAIAQRLVHRAIAVSTTMLGRSHNVRCTAVQEQLEAKEVQPSQPSSTSLLMISSRLT